MAQGIEKRPTVMIVEDAEDIRELMQLMLEARGYRVVVAADGQQAVETACRENPDLILMDISLPILDGLAATRRIHEFAATREVPVVAVSANDPTRCRPAAFAAGCLDYVTKPVNFKQLDVLLSRYLP